MRHNTSNRIIFLADLIVLLALIGYLSWRTYSPVTYFNCYPHTLIFHTDESHRKGAVYFRSDAREIRIIGDIPEWISVEENARNFRFRVIDDADVDRVDSVKLGAYSTFLGIPVSHIEHVVTLVQEKDVPRK